MLREREVGGVGTGSRCERVCEPSRRHHLHLGQLGANLTKLSKDQADYIGVKEDGPYKPSTYRY